MLHDETDQDLDLDPGDLIPSSLAPRACVEAIVFAAKEPLRAAEIAEILGDQITPQQVSEELAELSGEYRERSGGIHLVYIQDRGFQFQTVPTASILMERMFRQRPRPLSRAAQETLAIVAYRQPVTRAEIEFIRGVDAGSILKNLLDRDLVECLGRREEAIGRPMVFGTSPGFLSVYGLTSLKELPPLESFQPAPGSLDSAVQRLDEVALGEKVQEDGDLRLASENMEEDPLPLLRDETSQAASGEPASEDIQNQQQQAEDELEIGSAHKDLLAALQRWDEQDSQEESEKDLS